MSKPSELIQCTKCGTLIAQDKASTIQFYLEHKPVPYCPRCFEAIPYVYKRQFEGRITQG